MCMPSDISGESSGFRMLAWPLVEEQAPARGVVWDVVTRRGLVGVMLGRHRSGSRGWLTCFSGSWPGFSRGVGQDMVMRR